MQLIRQAAGEERFARIEINALVQRVVITEDRRKAAEELAGVARDLTADEVLECPYVLAGTIEQITQRLLVYRERWGISGYTVQEADMESFAPVLARLAGQ